MRENSFGHRLPTPIWCPIRWAVVSTAWLLVTMSLSAQEPTEPATERDREAQLKQGQAFVDLLEVRLAGGGDKIARIDKPILVYGDSTRNNADGTLWAWGKEGRPLAVLETYRNTLDAGPRASAVTLTSDSTVAMKVTGQRVWQPGKTQIKPALLPNAPPVDEREAHRLRHLKHESRRFTAHEFWDPDNSRFELRLLVQPVHRYRDEKAKIWDGAIFILAHGTNPEVLVLIEALGESLEKSKWHYSLARLGSAELHVEIDGGEVWKQERTPGVVGRPADPYWLFMTEAR